MSNSYSDASRVVSIFVFNSLFPEYFDKFPMQIGSLLLELLQFFRIHRPLNFFDNLNILPSNTIQIIGHFDSFQ